MTVRSRSLFDELFASEAMRDIFSDRARVQGMLDFEAALARAEAGLGVIPPEAATPIVSQCRAERFDVDRLAQGAALAGNAAIPLVAALTDLVARQDPDAARFVHWGATSQDAMDTGLVLQLRAALGLLDADLGRLADALAELVRAHQRTVVLGRTWLQPALPVTFGLKAAGWLSATSRGRERLRALRGRVLVIQFGGAAGTLASLGARGLDVATHLAQDLALAVPDLPWHAQRDRIAEVAAALGLLAGSLGKMARDLSLMMQSEVAEAFEPHAPGRGGSSTMPHKRNPTGAAAILAAATRIPGLVATLLSAMPQEHERGLGGWQAEWESLPEICLLTSGALMHAVQVIEGLHVDAERMRANVDATRGVLLAEAVALALARTVGRSAAHALVERACRRAMAEGRSLRDVLAAEPEVTTRLSVAELDDLCDPAAYLGLAEDWSARVLAQHSRGARRSEA
ncbi:MULTISPECIES: 3-carboxy-cis,cis-muconate cycloisomerase [Sorangium]|uniref:3-carboxy-cis,cis-muconate cycloisomerase n=1 Tax=Sorangium cellulosum TaxID=56 RepID=A0A4P2R1G7_SORCE|nr:MULTISPECIES: 3-carboxy-cis,cis-muconate cycloisomerase [Sorangium]AUX36769.1 3-carboxy-cis,cis-muconate cycloisomerase [Sorangium cellulosum]WCQ96067.1 3-carboxy-cis,cis-muconate cycloisomerase [Sorangium sp. Soce836]